MSWQVSPGRWAKARDFASACTARRRGTTRAAGASHARPGATVCCAAAARVLKAWRAISRSNPRAHPRPPNRQAVAWPACWAQARIRRASDAAWGCRPRCGGLVLLLFQERIQGPKNASIARFDGLGCYQTRSGKTPGQARDFRRDFCGERRQKGSSKRAAGGQGSQSWSGFLTQRA